MLAHIHDSSCEMQAQTAEERTAPTALRRQLSSCYCCKNVSPVRQRAEMHGLWQAVEPGLAAAKAALHSARLQISSLRSAKRQSDDHHESHIQVSSSRT